MCAYHIHVYNFNYDNALNRQFARFCMPTIYRFYNYQKIANLRKSWLVPMYRFSSILFIEANVKQMIYLILLRSTYFKVPIGKRTCEINSTS